MLFDDILKQLGEFGTFQKRVYLLASLICIPWAFHAIGSVFLAAKTDHWCASPSEFTDSINCTDKFGLDEAQCEVAKKNLTIPHQIVSGKLVYEQCERFNSTYSPNANETATRKCDVGWLYDRSQYKSTVVQEVS